MRRITLNRRSFPTALIEAAVKDGGLGIPRISVDCQLAKLADMRRAMTRSDHHKDTMMALVNSAFKAANQPLIARQVVLRPTYYTDTWWISSAVDFLQSQHLTLTLNNPAANPHTLLLHQKFPDMNLQTTNALSLYSIASQQELFMEGDRPPPLSSTQSFTHYASHFYQPNQYHSGQTKRGQ